MTRRGCRGSDLSPLGRLLGGDMPTQGKKRNQAGRELGDDPEWTDQPGIGSYRIVIDREIFMAMGIVALFFLMGKIVGEFKELVLCCPELHGRMIRDAKQIEGVVVNAALHIFVLDAANLDLPVHPLVLGRIRVVWE